LSSYVGQRLTDKSQGEWLKLESLDDPVNISGIMPSSAAENFLTLEALKRHVEVCLPASGIEIWVSYLVARRHLNSSSKWSRLCATEYGQFLEVNIASPILLIRPILR
jgi:hypothetical protein